MPRLDYVATLRDSVSPGLRQLAATATDLTDVLSGVTLSGTGLTQTLSQGLMRLSNDFSELLDSINRLVVLRVITAIISGAFNLLSRAINLTLQAASALFNGIQVLIEVFTTALSVIRSVANAFSNLSGRGQLLTAGIALLVSGLAQLDNAFNQGRAQATLFSRVIEGVTGVLINLVSSIVPSVARGVGTALLNEIRPFVQAISGVIGIAAEDLQAVILQFAVSVRDSITQNINPGDLGRLRELGAELRALREENEQLGDGSILPEGAIPIVREMTSVTMRLATQAIVPLIERFQELVGPIEAVLGRWQEFTSLSVETFAGNVSLLPGVVQEIFRRGAERIRGGGEVVTSEIIATLGAARRGALRGLTTLSQALGDGANEAVNNLVATFSEAAEREAAEEALNDLLSVATRPENFAALDQNVITEQVRFAVLAYKDTTAELIAAAEDRAQQLGLIEETSAQRTARINAQAAAAQIQSFLQASGQLVRDRQDLAIALATLDAGVAIAGAFAHGARLGPVYLAAYVGTVAANLANTINSIRSLSSPVGTLAQVAPPTEQAEPAARAGPEVSITVIGDNFSAEQLRRTSEEITGALGGQITV